MRIFSNGAPSSAAEANGYIEGLLAAIVRDDQGELIRLAEMSHASTVLMWTAGLPTAIAAGSDGGGDSMADLARDFWERYGEKNPKPIQSPRIPVKVSVSPGADERLTRIAREFFGDDGDA